jgi:hypothetical protein
VRVVHAVPRCILGTTRFPVPMPRHHVSCGGMLRTSTGNQTNISQETVGYTAIVAGNYSRLCLFDSFNVY